jgi:hypothetical protein
LIFSLEDLIQKRFASLILIAVCLLIVRPLHAGPPSAATTRTRVGLVLMAQFPDRPGDVTITPAEIDDFCNDPNYTAFGNATSVYGYFRIQSNGRLQYNNVVTAYFTAAQDRSYYTDNSIAFGTRAKELVT